MGCGGRALIRRIRFRILSLVPSVQRLMIGSILIISATSSTAKKCLRLFLKPLCVWHQVDTVIMTGGSTSGCIRATAVDSLSRGYRTIVPEECVADKHESYHFANLTDLSIKYADVLGVGEVLDWLSQQG